ncbi:MAG TPA: multidrug effflux MFS transporter [Acetobacteraceae bacterium]|jgi:DHA1 family bicyclomycin/chloramphenicol resistance-like MFS transporter|nr:multidrug effflux MFS transporter [Acetobacteraceae bacterium]
MKFPVWLPALLGFLIAVGPAATDMYLPAFPAVEASLHSPPGSAQLTLAAWFAGLAFGQITQGSVSDRFGRRRPLMAGTALFTLSCIGCALAPSIGWLAGFRFVSAFAGSASMVIPRAVVRDLADGQAAGILMSRLMLVMGVAPILAPSIGGAVLLFAHWRVIFVILAVYGATACVLVWRFLPETFGPAHRIRLSPGEQLSRYRQILRERGFVTHALMGGCASFGMFAYLGGSSPVFIQGFGLAPSVFALVFGLNSIGLIVCSQVNAQLLRRYTPSEILAGAQQVALGSALVLCVVAFGGFHVLPLVMAPIFVSISCMGFTNANAMVGALSRHAAHAGSAAALMGVGQYSLGATSGLLVGLLTDGTPRGMALLMFLGSLGSVIAQWFRPRAS